MLVLGFDYGHRKIGIASGQTLTAQASPLTTLAMVQQRPDWEGIERLIKEWLPQRLLVGLPLNMDDSETHLTPRVRRFARQLTGRYHLPVELVDERLTTMEARSSFGHKTKDRGLDAYAAKLIIETWLESYDPRAPSSETERG
jgi:putative Holliday junction resolvase